MENICKYSLHNWKNCASTSVKLFTTVVPGDATSSAVPRQLFSHTCIFTHWRAHTYSLESNINLKLLVQLLLYTFVFVSSSSTFTKYLTKTSKAQNIYVLAHCFRRSQPIVVAESWESSSVNACGCMRLRQQRLWQRLGAGYSLPACPSSATSASGAPLLNDSSFPSWNC